MKRISILTIVICFVFSLVSCNFMNKSGDIHAIKGMKLYNNGELTEALEELDKAVELGTNEYELKEIYTIMGNCYNDLDRFEKAIEMHEKALELDSQYYTAWVNLGITYRQSGDLAEAEKCYSEAIEINPEYAELRSSLGSLYILKEEPERAVEEFERAVELDPSLAVAYGNGALAYAMVGDFDKAEEFLKQSKVLGYKNASIIQERIDSIKNGQ